MKANKKIGITDFLEQKAKIINATIEKYLPRKIDADALIFKISPPR